MKYLYLVLAVLLLNTSSLFAQSNFKSGYIITLQGDTLKGYIDYKDWGINPSSISFKKDLEQSRAENFTIGTCKAFGVNGYEQYDLYNVQISLGKVTLPDVATGIDTTYTTGAVFLRKIIAGDLLILYSYFDNVKQRFYIKDNNIATPVELQYRVYYDLSESRNVVVQKRFGNQLTAIADKYGKYNEKLAKVIQNSSYTESQLVKIVSLINPDIAALNTYKQLGKKLGTQFYAGIGVNLAKLKYGNEILSAAGAQTSIFPKVNFGLNIYPNKNVRKFYFRADVAFTAAKINTTIQDYKIDEYIVLPEINSRVDQYTISISPQFIYNYYNTDKFKAFVDFGASLNFSKYNNVGVTVNNPDTQRSLPLRSTPPEYNNAWNCILLRTGITLKNKIDIDFTYLLPSSISSDPILNNSKMGFYQLGINYRFGSL